MKPQAFGLSQAFPSSSVHEWSTSNQAFPQCDTDVVKLIVLAVQVPQNNATA